MNICLLCRNIHKDLGGIETFVRDYSKALAQEGHKVHIIAQDNGEHFKQPPHANITIHSLYLKDKPFIGYWFIDSFFPIDELRFGFAASRHINTISRSTPIDIVEVMDYFRQGIGMAFNKKIPVFLRLHGWMFNKAGYWKYSPKELNSRERFQKLIEQKCIDRADGIGSVSHSFAQYASTVWEIPQSKLSVIHNAVDLAKYKPKDGIVREKAIIFSARMLKNKGVVVFVEALIKIFKKFPELKVYFAGSDQQWPEDKITAKEFIQRKLPSNNIVFLGVIPADSVIHYYQTCLISVLPSLYEPFGLSALEAMSCGCAMIASKAGGLPEFIEHERNGLLFNSNDPEDLSKSIERFLTDDNLREVCVKKALIKMNEEYSYTTLIKSSIKAYVQAIKEHHV